MDDKEAAAGVATTLTPDEEADTSSATTECVHDKVASAVTLARVMRLVLNMSPAPVLATKNAPGSC